MNRLGWHLARALVMTGLAWSYTHQAPVVRANCAADCATKQDPDGNCISTVCDPGKGKECSTGVCACFWGNACTPDP